MSHLRSRGNVRMLIRALDELKMRYKREYFAHSRFAGATLSKEIDSSGSLALRQCPISLHSSVCSLPCEGLRD